MEKTLELIIAAYPLWLLLGMWFFMGRKPNGDYWHDTRLLKSGCAVVFILLAMLALVFIAGIALFMGPQ